jgi:hypothetical protein
MNLARSVSPSALGTYADVVGTTWCMWTCVFISIFAAIVNVPLLWAPILATHSHRVHLDDKTADAIGGDYELLDTDDTDQVEKVMKGDWVPAKLLAELNADRFNAGVPFLLPPVRSYTDDKGKLCNLYRNAREDFEYQHFRQYYYLSLQHTPEHKRDVVEHLNQSIPSKDVQKERADAMGQWFADYMDENGYFLDGGQVNLMKQMIMHAFPVINRDGEVNEKNIEQTTLRFAAVTNEFFLKSIPTKAEQGFRNSVVM